MNITFLIGNGFDLGLGLKTKYSDYYDIFCNDGNYRKSSNLAEEIKGNIKDWSDFEKRLGEYTTNFSRKTEAEFFDEIEEFAEGFFSYLSTEEQKIFYNPELIVPTFEEALLHFFEPDIIASKESQRIKDIFKTFASKGCVFNFINFNYTDTFEKCLEIFSNSIDISTKDKIYSGGWRIGDLIHVHGVEGNSSIIGVDNSRQIKNNELSSDPNFTQRFVKPQMDNYIGMQFSEKAQIFIKNSKIICVYGMSIGATDATWWHSIAAWLKGDSSRRVILFMHDRDFNDAISSRTIGKKNEIIRSFLGYSQYNKYIQQDLSKQVYVALNKNIFTMNLVC